MSSELPVISKERPCRCLRELKWTCIYFLSEIGKGEEGCSAQNEAIGTTGDEV